MMRRRSARVVAIGLAAMVLAGGCGGSGDDSREATATAGDTITLDIALDDVVGVVSIDRRPDLLAELGGPDAFVIKADEIAGEVSRLESWSYFAGRSQVDLIDGEILWTTAVDDLPDGSWLPIAYSPMEFTLLASVADTLAALPGVDLRSLPDAASELEVAGAEIWAGEQLTLVFIDDALIYVEAFPLAPGQPGEPT